MAFLAMPRPFSFQMDPANTIIPAVDFQCRRNGRTLSLYE
jgi:hypothetical protein